MAINVLVFFVRSPSLPTTGAACLMPSAILYNGEVRRTVSTHFTTQHELTRSHRQFARLVTSAFYHGTDMHLYFNMASLLYKVCASTLPACLTPAQPHLLLTHLASRVQGLTLERHFGSTGFAQIVLSMLLGSHILYVAVAWASVQLGLKWGVM